MRGSRMFLCLAILAGVVVLLTGIAQAPVGMFPAWVAYLAGVGGLALTAVVTGLKAEDNKIGRARAKAPLPAARPWPHDTLRPPGQLQQPRDRGQRGFVTLDTIFLYCGGLSVGLFIILGLLALFASGCATWPEACDTSITGGVSCSCPTRTMRCLPDPGGKPRPAGLIEWYCGDEKMPIEDRSDDVDGVCTGKRGVAQ